MPNTFAVKNQYRLTPPTEVVIAAEHPVVHIGLSTLIRETFCPEANVVVYGDYKEALQYIESRRAGRSTVLIADIQGCSISEVGSANLLRGVYSNLRILLVGDCRNDAYASACVAAGAHAYLPKQASPSAFVEAIAKILNPEVFVGVSTRQNESPFECLSEREKVIAHCLVVGHTMREVSESLGIRYTTVATYKKRVFKKLGVDSLPAFLKLCEQLNIGEDAECGPA